MKSQSNKRSTKNVQVPTQSELTVEQILRSHAGKVLGTDYKHGTEQTKTALLQLALSCLLEKMIEPETPSHLLTHDEAIELSVKVATVHTWNAAIDTIEQNILKAFS